MGCCQGKQEVGYSQVSEKEPREDDSGSDDELAEHADDVVSVVGLESTSILISLYYIVLSFFLVGCRLLCSAGFNQGACHVQQL